MAAYGKRQARKIFPILVLGAVVAGMVFNAELGDLSSFGWKEISLLCPLGSLEILLASKMFIPQALISFLVLLVLVVLLGRVFCGFVCPVLPLKRLLRKRDQHDSAECVSRSERVAGKRAVPHLGSRYAVLGAALASSLIFGFPVFCLICPVGLLFGLIAALILLFTKAEATALLVVAPAVIILELVLCKSWCHRLCPIGALISVMSLSNRTFRPFVDRNKCRLSKGERCGLCVARCPEGANILAGESLNECTKCGACQEECPQDAISFPLMRE